jgi:P-type Cu+ transporter
MAKQLRLDAVEAGVEPARKVAHVIKLRAGGKHVFAFLCNALGIPIAAGVPYPFFGLLLSPLITGAAMSLISLSVITNALRL